MKVAILNFNNSVMSSVIGPFDIFNQINSLVDSFRPDLNIPKIEVQILESEDVTPRQTFDLIIIPAMHFNKIEQVLSENQHLKNWLISLYNKGCEIASICLGAFILADFGLLDNTKATTHWLGAPMFRKLYPKVTLVDDKFVTDYNRIYTSGGAYSFTTLMVYLINKYFGSEVAVLISKVFLIHLHDSQQTGFKILDQQKNHSNKTIMEIQDFIENNLESELSIEFLANTAHMSQRTFMRNFKKFTGDSPKTYIQKVRIEKAKRLLEIGDTGIEQICLQVGYNDFASFRKIFKKLVGLNPSEYKKLYTRAFTDVNIAR